MKNTDYFAERNLKNSNQLKVMLISLPSFCDEYFRGIENKTTPLTRLGYANDLKTFFEFLVHEIDGLVGKKIKDITLEDLNNITQTDLEIYLNYLSNYTKNGEQFSNDARAKARKLSAVRSLFRYFYRKDKLRENVTTKIDTPKIRDKEIIRLEVDEVVKLLDTAEHPKDFSKRQQSYNKLTRTRDIAILTLLLGTGIRVSECVGLNVEDIDFETNGFKITRKGGAQTILYFSDEVSTTLQNYLDERLNNEFVSPSEHALFLSIQNKRIGVRAVEQLVKKYSQDCIPLKHITPHKLRSTYGTNLYRETGDIYIVADVLGHRDVNTTKKHYAAISEDARRRVANVVKLRDNDEN